MLIFVDTNIVIYAVENPPLFGARARARLQALQTNDSIVASELIRTECCLYPLRAAKFNLLRAYDVFFKGSNVVMASINTNVFRRTTAIRASYHYSLIDSIHLATAAEYGCDNFLTHDARLASFADLNMEQLT